MRNALPESQLGHWDFHSIYIHHGLCYLCEKKLCDLFQILTRNNPNIEEINAHINANLTFYFLLWTCGGVIQKDPFPLVQTCVAFWFKTCCVTGMSFLLSLSVGGFQYETDPTSTICCLFRTNIKVSPSMIPAFAQFRTLPSCNPTTFLLCQLLC